jgi:hypothetical protein
MFRRLLPKETSFFDYFEEHSKFAMQACRELDLIASNPLDLAGGVSRVKEIEHQADEITHSCIDALHRTFITPIDRSDIHRLIKKMDDIVDSVDSASSRMLLYELTEVRPELKQFTEVLVRATTAIDGAVRSLRNVNQANETINKHCMEVHAAENEGDQILRSALATLFREEKDAVLVIKWKEIFERLEKATDRCEDVVNIVEGVVIEAS